MNKLLLSMKMQFRVPISIFFSLIFPILMMVIMIVSYGNFSIGGKFHFIDKYFLISTSIGLVPIAVISFPIWLTESIQNQTLKRLKYFNVNIPLMIFWDLISYMVLAILSVCLNIVVGKIFFNLQIPSIQYLVPFFIQIIYCIFTMFLLGTALALVIRNSRVAMPVGMIVLFMTYMLIGVFVQYDQLPNKLTNVSTYLPIKYITNDFYEIWIEKKLWNINFLKLNTVWTIVLSVFDYIFLKMKNTKQWR